MKESEAEEERQSERTCIIIESGSGVKEQAEEQRETGEQVIQVEERQVFMPG